MNDLVEAFRAGKASGRKIAALTAYDYPTARLVDEAGVDLILVGDSLGLQAVEHPAGVRNKQCPHERRALGIGHEPWR